ncbi:MAG: MBL fold metallo-hydrolase [Armatimonadota bacterium]
MVTLTSYGGANEIGGSKFLLTAGTTRVFLDFGVSFRNRQLYFEFPALQARCLDDLIKTGMVPNLTGLYRGAGIRIQYAEEESQYTILGAQEPREFEAVLLSHAHADHAGYLGLLHSDIPIYCSRTTKWMLQCLHETRGTDFCASDGGASVYDVPAGEWVSVGSIRFRRYDVDHSVPGASGFLVEAEGVKIAYTGDMRMHGNGPGGKATERFMEALAQEEPDYLICEGTRFPPSTPRAEESSAESHSCGSEAEVQERCAEVFQRPGLVVYDMSQMDLARLVSVMKAARDAGRRPVVDSKKGYMLATARALGMVEDLPDEWDFAVLLSRLKLASNDSVLKDLGVPDGVFVEAVRRRRERYEKCLIDREIPGLPSTVSVLWGPHGRKEVMSDPDRHVVITSDGPITLLQLLEPGGRIGGTYVYGKSEPFTEEMEFSFERLRNWLSLCEMGLEYAHASGHASRSDLERFVEVVQPRVVIPVHTASDRAFEGCAPRIVRLRHGCAQTL